MSESRDGQFQQVGQELPRFGADGIGLEESAFVAGGVVGADRALAAGGTLVDAAEALCVDAQTIEAALERLSLCDRMMIRLRHLDQLSFEQIASGLGLSTKAAETRWIRAIKNLCRELHSLTE